MGMKPETNKKLYAQRVKEAKEKHLSEYGDFDKITIEDIVTRTALLKQEYDSLGERIEGFKSFFKEIGVSGEQFDGNPGTVNLIGRATSTVEPVDLRNLLDSLGRTAEFMDMVSVKVADSRKKLGTVLFDKIADVVPDASITVKIGTK